MPNAPMFAALLDALGTLRVGVDTPAAQLEPLAATELATSSIPCSDGARCAAWSRSRSSPIR
jgi:hypothetical protein